MLGWGVVAAWVGAWMVSTWTRNRSVQVLAAMIAFIGVALPGPWGGAFWLTLALQAPSVATVLLSAAALASLWKVDPVAPSSCLLSRANLPLVVGVLVLGWALLLDTLGLLPFAVYGWGFSAAAPATALVLVACPWVIAGRLRPDAGLCVAALSILVFVIWHLPSGNFFDAAVDPGLWVVLHFVLWTHLKRRKKTHRTAP